MFENIPYDDDEKLEDHLKSIDWIEERVGFNFLPEIEAKTGEAGIEVRLEATAATTLWN